MGKSFPLTFIFFKMVIALPTSDNKYKLCMVYTVPPISGNVGMVDSWVYQLRAVNPRVTLPHIPHLLPSGQHNFQHWPQISSQTNPEFTRILMLLPSGKRLHSYNKSQFLIGKSTISLDIFNSTLLVHQRGRLEWYGQDEPSCFHVNPCTCLLRNPKCHPHFTPMFPIVPPLFSFCQDFPHDSHFSRCSPQIFPKVPRFLVQKNNKRAKSTKDLLGAFQSCTSQGDDLGRQRAWGSPHVGKLP